MVKPVRYRGREYAVIERLRPGHRTWLAVARLGSAGRQCWQAYDPASRAMRAVHRLPGSRSTMERLRVLQELNDGNPELPQVLEFHRDGNDVWVVLPWIEGCDLRTYLNSVRQRTMRRISAPEAVRLMRGLAHALAHLHRRKGIIHGDIKPSNLILTNRTRLVLIDYGSAWTVERTTSRTGGDGTIGAYTAPELLRGDPHVNFRADHFSICVVLYELLTLSIPYDGQGGKAGLRSDIDRTESFLVPPGRVSRDADRMRRAIRARIDKLVGRGLRIDADARFDTSREWLDAWDELMHEIRRPAALNGVSRSLLRFISWCGARLGGGHR